MRLLLCALLLGLTFSVSSQNVYNLIPAPKQLTPLEGKFIFKQGMTISIGDVVFEPVAKLLSQRCNASAGLTLPIRKGKSGRGIVFVTNNSLADEAYQLSIASGKIEIQAKTGQGAFYAIQSLLQLMPSQVYGTTREPIELSVPKCTIEDEPRFAYRGLMLDVGRHFEFLSC